MGALKLTYQSYQDFLENEQEKAPNLRIVPNHEPTSNPDKNYYAFGSLLPGRYSGGSDYRYGFQGSEKDDEIKSEGNSYTTTFRQYDPRLGRWLSTDPVVKYHESPYAWNTNNPISFIDVLGADSTQRANAVAQAEKYVEKGTGTSSSYLLGSKKGPGNPVDCSGLVSNCVTTAGEPNPNKGSSNGVSNIAANTKEVPLNDLQVGNLITFNSNSHIGIVSGNIVKDKEGNVVSFSVIQSATSTGPKEIKIQADKSSSWTNGNDGYWSPKLGKAYKWDTKPDKPAISVETSVDVASKAASVSSSTVAAATKASQQNSNSDSSFLTNLANLWNEFWSDVSNKVSDPANYTTKRIPNQ